MDNKTISILLIEDNPADARLLQEVLADASSSLFELTHVDRLSAGLERLAKGGIDIALLDLSLPDSHGIQTLIRTHTHSPQVPIVVLTSLDDEALAIEALKRGAQDYLIKGQVESGSLVRFIRYAIERHRLQNV